jgi:MSHA biogenesis protein MshP
MMPMPTPRSHGHGHSTQRGMGAIVAVMVVVMLSGLAAGLVRLTWTGELTSASDLMSAKARQAARAGIEWGLYQTLRGSWSGCTSSTQTLDLRSVNGMWVTVTCNSNATPYVEGADNSSAPRNVRIYNIEAIACNGTASCPDNASAAKMGYVERRQRTSVSDVEVQP